MVIRLAWKRLTRLRPVLFGQNHLERAATTKLVCAAPADRFAWLAAFVLLTGCVAVHKPESASQAITEVGRSDPSIGAANDAGIQIGTVKVRAPKLRDSIEFYTRVFGLRVVGRYDLDFPLGSGTPLIEVALKPPGLGEAPSGSYPNILTNTVILMARPNEGKLVVPSDGLPAFVMVVPNVDAVAERARQTGHGNGLVEGPTNIGPKFRVLFVSDPSGNVIECIAI